MPIKAMETIGRKLDTPQRLYYFDELLFLPGLAKRSPRDIDVSVELGGLRLRVPLISSPMDTVTGPELASALALKGGLGVIHRNCTVPEAVDMVKAVKNAKIPEGYESTALKDGSGRLAVGAAISTSDLDRARALAQVADLLFTDVASFHNMKIYEGMKRVISTIRDTGKKVVLGNFGTKEGVMHAVKELGKENIAAIKVGMGSGSICTTTDVTGVGSPAAFATEQAALALSELGLLDEIPIISDGGIRHSRDIALCMGLGASMAMLGNVFARCEESAGEKVERDGKLHKVYWGMGSAQARKKRLALDRYQASGKEVNEGIRMYVPVEGRVDDVVDRLVAEMQVTMGYVGAANVKEMREVTRIVVRNATAPKVEPD